MNGERQKKNGYLRSAAPWLGCVAFLAIPFAVIAADPPGWELLWEDDFETLDEDRWERVSTTKPTNKSLQVYLPEQVTVEAGNLVITATDESYPLPDGSLEYRSGQVISRAEQLYGRWEVRAKLPTSTGQWPAIWLLPDVSKYAWPSGGEIDIMENRGNQPTLTSSAFHYGTRSPYQHDYVYDEQRTINLGKVADYHSGFHTYAVDWTKKCLRFYVDGVQYYTVHDEDVGGFLSQSVQPMQLVINNAIGGTFLPDPDDTSVWPQRMEIDWVRVYRAASEPADHRFANGGFEEDGGTLAGWSVFGNDLLENPNVSTSDTTTLEGESALKLFGTFENSDGGSYSGVTQGVTVEGGDRVEASLSASVRSVDPLLGGNQALLKIEFYSEFGAKYGSESMLAEEQTIIANSVTKKDVWAAHRLQAVAPAGSVEARLSIVFHQPAAEGGAVFVDGVAFGASPPVAQDDFGRAIDPASRRAARLTDVLATPTSAPTGFLDYAASSNRRRGDAAAGPGEHDRRDRTMRRRDAPLASATPANSH